MALKSADDDKYQGDGIIDAGTQAVVVDYASHQTNNTDDPVVRVKGFVARVHASAVEPL